MRLLLADGSWVWKPIEMKTKHEIPTRHLMTRLLLQPPGSSFSPLPPSGVALGICL